MLASNS